MPGPPGATVAKRTIKREASGLSVLAKAWARLCGKACRQVRNAAAEQEGAPVGVGVGAAMPGGWEVRFSG